MVATCVFAFASPVWAEDCKAPCAGYEMTVEVDEDWTFAAKPSTLKSSVFQPSVTSDLYFIPTEGFRLNASLITESVAEAVPGRNYAFSGISTYVGEFSASIDWDPVSLKVGKFDPAFGLVNDVLPGQNSTDLASAFATDERWGGEAALAFEAAGFNNSLAISAFSTDRTALAGSLFTERHRTRLSDGGAGNTPGISSFSAVLSGCMDADPEGCYDNGSLGYRWGIRQQRKGQITQDQIDDGLVPHDEQAVLYALMTRLAMPDDMALHVMGETAFFKHFEGGEDDALQLTASAALDVGQLRYIAAYTRQNNIIAFAPNTHHQLLDFEAIYTSDEGQPFEDAKWSLGAAYTWQQNATKEENHIISLKAELTFGGTTRKN